MVGLSVVLEGHKSNNSINTVSNSSFSSSSCSTSTIKVINKANMIINNSNNSNNNKVCSFSSFTSNFLDQCFLCNQKLMLGKDIYMYKGDRAFCSVECRHRQIFMDEEESKRVKKKEQCSMASVNPNSSSSHQRKGTRNRAL